MHIYDTTGGSTAGSCDSYPEGRSADPIRCRRAPRAELMPNYAEALGRVRSSAQGFVSVQGTVFFLVLLADSVAWHGGTDFARESPRTRMVGGWRSSCLRAKPPRPFGLRRGREGTAFG